MTLLAGVVVAGLLQFPGALGATWALAISAVIQLSAAWTPPSQRDLIHKTSGPSAFQTPQVGAFGRTSSSHVTINNCAE